MEFTLYIYKNILNGYVGDVWWVDASSSALQLIAAVRGFKSPLLGQLLNIVENKTEFKGIYDYVLFKLKNLSLVKLNEMEMVFLNYWDLDLVKRIIMPAAYGKTKWMCFKDIEESLCMDLTWLEMTNERRKALKSF